jgi:predicted component of type VI protein secretion system
MSSRIVRLSIISRAYTGTTIEILANSRKSIGRNEKADYSVDDRCMTSLHFEVENFGDLAVIRDRGSRSGTWLNARLINDEMELVEGDEIRAGQTIFRVQFLRERDPK